MAGFEAKWRIAVGNRLLIDKSHIAGPPRRSKTGPAPACTTAALVGTNVKVKIGFGGDVRNIAQCGRALVGGANHACKLLPRGNRNVVLRNSAATVDPCGLRTPGAARFGHL